MSIWGDKPYYSLNYYLRELYGEKIYKIAIDGGFTCPNRDGKIDTRGCIFCSKGGSGDFASSASLSIYDQIEEGKKRLSFKKTGNKYIAYFQAYTNTYAPINHLKVLFREAISHPDIIGLSVATRPDCLDNEVIKLLATINKTKKVWVELGLQSIYTSSASFIRRGYELECYDNAVTRLTENGLEVIVHLILGLPNETKEDVLQSVRYICGKNIGGIKLQLLHVLKNTDLADYYYEQGFKILSMDEYIDLLISCIEIIPPNIVIHRITGDGPKNLLIEPLWSGNKKVVLNTILKEFKNRNTWQGKKQPLT
ncbi:TIGR01212 family radical SAM protein [Vallitalea sp.]|jgi:radical SAM protein (TIGR01212 family)|uniref:TIGR01212 family radical SAM protein n=1 Tax=Vallitalea sp. TaxID=1882829 RepID=UPI0025E681BB|nr:TIGR01212 family radical SAM protein [Vallitalea sp.]MCT4685882.1 TIGR01212 family radical SAM protein [Vallitalea sp.]